MSESQKQWLINGADTFEILKEDNPYDYYPCEVVPRGEFTVGEWELSHPSNFEPPSNPGLGKQVGGTHYQEMTIQPMEYSYANKLNPIAHSIIKYATRAGKKDSEDIRKEIQKIKHCADIWLDLLNKHGEK